MLIVRIGTLMDTVSSETLQWTSLSSIKSTGSEKRLSESYWELKGGRPRWNYWNCWQLHSCEITCTSSYCLTATACIKPYICTRVTHHSFTLLLSMSCGHVLKAQLCSNTSMGCIYLRLGVKGFHCSKKKKRYEVSSDIGTRTAQIYASGLGDFPVAVITVAFVVTPAYIFAQVMM